MSIDIWQGLLLIAVGILSGWLNVLAGGGSLLTVPILLFMGLPGAVANGTNRIAIITQNIAAVSTFFRNGFSDIKLSLSLASVAVPGAVVGAMIGVQIREQWFNYVLALVMAIIMLLMALGNKTAAVNKVRSDMTMQQLWLGHLCMFAVGLWGGFIQIGVGLILMPVLNRVLGLDLIRVNMHKVFIVLTYSIAAIAVYASQVQLAWVIGLCLAVGTALGGWLGARTSIVRGERWIRWTLNIVLIVFIVKLIFFST